VLGREVATLVNEEQSAGWKEVQWNGKDIWTGVSAKGGYASGVYFYKIEAVSGGNEIFIESKKMFDDKIEIMAIE
jgi:hypothetical protein